MAKSKRSYMVRRGHRYLIERSAEGTFIRFVPKGKAAAKRTATRKASSKISSKSATKSSLAKPSHRARVMNVNYYSRCTNIIFPVFFLGENLLVSYANLNVVYS